MKENTTKKATENTKVIKEVENQPKLKKVKASKKLKLKDQEKVESKAKEEKKKKVIKEVESQQKISIIEQVISNREVKYIYPEDIDNTLDRKKWRQQVRNELRKLEREMYRIKDQTSKEFAKAKKAYESYKATVLKPEQVA